ncbi:MAG: AI-2E family transporter [Anaerolineales bacterium]
MSGPYESWMLMPEQKRKRIGLVVLTFSLLLWILWSARAVLWPFALGLGMAYILAPFVRGIVRGLEWVARKSSIDFLTKIARPFAIVVSYLVLIGLLVGFFALVVPLVVEQSKALWEQRDSIWEFVSRVGEDLLAQFQLLPARVQQQVEEALNRLGTTITDVFTQALESTASAISYTVSLVIAIAVIPFWTFYLLKDSTALGKALMCSMPDVLRDDVRAVGALVDRDLGGFLRGQLLMMLAVGLMSTAGYSIVGLNFAVLLGLIAGLLEFIPNLGPLLGAIPAVLVALTINPVMALWTALVAFIVQQIENLVLAPRVLGESVQLHPVVIMVVLVIGSEIAGLVGLFLAPIVTAVLRDLFRYFYFRFSTHLLTPEQALARVLKREDFCLNIED